MLKRHTHLMLVLPSLVLLARGLLIETVLFPTASIIRLSANPQGDATACVGHPSQATCTPTVSPFGTGQPGAPGCARSASIPALIALSDPIRNETPIATLQLWHSSDCHAAFASATTSSLLGFEGTFTITVTIQRHVHWWQSIIRETRIQSSKGA